MMSPKKPSPKKISVDQYLATLAPATRTTMSAMLNFLAVEFPQLESKIAWNVPQLLFNGKYVIGLAAFKNHLTVGSWSPVAIKTFRARLTEYVTGTRTFRIPIGWQIDERLMRDLVRARLKEIERL